MNLNKENNFQRYLAAKKSIDNRALNRRVWEDLTSELHARNPDGPVRVLEVGAGIGTMLERALEWGLLIKAHYTALDLQPENFEYAVKNLRQWVRRSGGHFDFQAENRFLLQLDDMEIWVEFVVAELLDFFQKSSNVSKWDLVIASAFLDLVDISTALPVLFEALSQWGLFYFSLNFDGLTVFEPVIDPELDDLIMSLYHRTMDERLVAGLPSGTSRTGRKLFGALKQLGAALLSAGASDWIVYPDKGGYPADEAYFLYYILGTIHNSLSDSPELTKGVLDEWIESRQGQVKRGELVYIAHQLDILGAR
jgi:SAM-dependent methyltransferase